MLDLVQLTEKEFGLLLQHKKKSFCELISVKAHAILLFHKGYSGLQIADILFRDEKTIREWVKSFGQERIASLFPHTLNNQNAARLTREQKLQIKDVLSKPPSDYGIPTSFWDISTLKRYIKAEFGVEYESDESYRLIFQLYNYSFHLPATFDIHRNEKTIAKRMKEIKKEIKPMFKDPNWIIFASDESRIIWETIIRRLWLPKGQKTIIKVERERKAQSFIGLLNLKTGEELLYRLSWQKQDTIIPVLEEIVKKYPDKRICIIWDNARFHKSGQTLCEGTKLKNPRVFNPGSFPKGKKIKAKLKTALKNIHLINFPAYAPDHNPQEYVWKYGKDKLANNQKRVLRRNYSCF